MGVNSKFTNFFSRVKKLFGFQWSLFFFFFGVNLTTFRKTCATIYTYVLRTIIPKISCSKLNYFFFYLNTFKLFYTNKTVKLIFWLQRGVMFILFNIFHTLSMLRLGVCDKDIDFVWKIVRIMFKLEIDLLCSNYILILFGQIFYK